MHKPQPILDADSGVPCKQQGFYREPSGRLQDATVSSCVFCSASVRSKSINQQISFWIFSPPPARKMAADVPVSITCIEPRRDQIGVFSLRAKIKNVEKDHLLEDLRQVVHAHKPVELA